MSELIKDLEKYRVEHELTQEQLAGLIQVSTRTYQSIVKTGEVKRVDVLENINKLLASNTQNVSRETQANEPPSSYLDKRRGIKNGKETPSAIPAYVGNTRSPYFI